MSGHTLKEWADLLGSPIADCIFDGEDLAKALAPGHCPYPHDKCESYMDPEVCSEHWESFIDSILEHRTKTSRRTTTAFARGGV